MIVKLHSISDFIHPNIPIIPQTISYYYQGKCPQTGETLKLPRTTFAEVIAKGLMQQLSQNYIYSQEGKMYGILLVALPNGEQKVLKAFSGLLNGCKIVDGWVTPIPGREKVKLLETETLGKLENIKQEIIQLTEIPERQEYTNLYREFEQELETLKLQHQHSKQQRQEKRTKFLKTLNGEQLQIALGELEAESRQQGIVRKKLKKQQQQILQPLLEQIKTSDQKIQTLKKQRKEISRELQTQMHAAYSLTNFYGQSLSLQQLFPWGIPTGTGECCAPKLLHYAATHNLQPLAMAEFWWGESTVQDKIAGEFYGACIERCQPLMGFLLSGWKFPNSQNQQLEIIYEDQWLIAVNKPAGLLSVPGRYLYNQDSVFSRLINLYAGELMTVHRLDQDTSGILILAKDKWTQSQLHQQFQNRKVEKIYEAILSGLTDKNQGMINLPLWGNPEKRPVQIVDWEQGKPSLTQFQVMGKQGNYTRVEFRPLTGRSHQLRVHAADVQGLGIPILGDRLYGDKDDMNRLYLHAREIIFPHPHTQVSLHLKTETPF
ncbi:MAG: RluA family pseudouridine synthase [Sphaerospermopsis sp. SIO1G1]|nr:RluA family pseudouridine synthase [Sphaerospermopsis sp. SIO1G1]